jgi:hypothetical protein
MGDHDGLSFRSYISQKYCAVSGEIKTSLKGKDAVLERQTTTNFPTADWEPALNNDARKILQMADALEELGTHSRALIGDLQQDALDLATNGGRLGVMAEKRLGFGRGWPFALDRAIGNVAEAERCFCDSFFDGKDR